MLITRSLNRTSKLFKYLDRIVKISKHFLFQRRWYTSSPGDIFDLKAHNEDLTVRGQGELQFFHHLQNPFFSRVQYLIAFWCWKKINDFLLYQKWSCREISVECLKLLYNCYGFFAYWLFIFGKCVLLQSNIWRKFKRSFSNVGNCHKNFIMKNTNCLWYQCI